MGRKTNYDDGWQYGIEGFFAGLVVQLLLFVPDWGIDKWLFVLIGIIILICMGIATYKEVMSKDNKFAIGFIISTILMMIIGPSI